MIITFYYCEIIIIFKFIIKVILRDIILYFKKINLFINIYIYIYIYILDLTKFILKIIINLIFL